MTTSPSKVMAPPGGNLDFFDLRVVIERLKWNKMDAPNGKIMVGLDLETVPDMGAFPELLDLPTNDEIEEQLVRRIPGNIKKPETKLKWLTENRDAVRERILKEREAENGKLVSEWRKGALNSHVGQVVVIGFAFPGYPPTSIYQGGDLETEKDLIEALDWILHTAYEHFSKIRLVGHNIKGFDALWLSRLAVKYDCHSVMRAVTDISPLDTCELWQMTSRDYKERKSLDAISEYLGFAGKITLEDEVCDVLGLEYGSTMHGSLVSDLWRCGGVETLRRYCEADVSFTRALMERVNRIKEYARPRLA